MDAVVEGWRTAGPDRAGALVFLLVLSTFIAVIIEQSFFLPRHIKHGGEGIITWVLLTIGALVPLGLMVYSSYWGWHWTKDAHFRIAWIIVTHLTVET
jgi:hypothetical protein